MYGLAEREHNWGTVLDWNARGWMLGPLVLFNTLSKGVTEIQGPISTRISQEKDFILVTPMICFWTHSSLFFQPPSIPFVYNHLQFICVSWAVWSQRSWVQMWFFRVRVFKSLPSEFTGKLWQKGAGLQGSGKQLVCALLAGLTASPKQMITLN